MLCTDIDTSLALFSVLLGIPALYLAIITRNQLDRALALLAEQCRRQ